MAIIAPYDSACAAPRVSGVVIIPTGKIFPGCTGATAQISPIFSKYCNAIFDNDLFSAAGLRCGGNFFLDDIELRIIFLKSLVGYGTADAGDQGRWCDFRHSFNRRDLTSQGKRKDDIDSRIPRRLGVILGDSGKRPDQSGGNAGTVLGINPPIVKS